MDIKFYDLSLNLIYVLPMFTSLSVTQELCGIGEFEIHFLNDDIKSTIEEYKDNCIIMWDRFQGILTGYQFNKNDCAIFGKHLNALLHKAVFTEQQIDNAEIESTVRPKVQTYCSWLDLGAVAGISKAVTYNQERACGDEWVQNVLEFDESAGYEIYADAVLKTFTFRLIKGRNNSIVLSETNRNIYDLQTVYDNKTLAYRGWYKNEDNTWGSVTMGSKSGIFGQEVILSATTQAEAQLELEKQVSTFQTTGSIYNLKYGNDYVLGDSFAVECNGNTTYKRVIKINITVERERLEQPTLREVIESE